MSEEVITSADVGVLRIVEGVAIASGQGGQKTDLSRKIEAAMQEAVLAANAEGISVNDSDQLKERMMAARQRILDEHYGRTEKPAEG